MFSRPGGFQSGRERRSPGLAGHPPSLVRTHVIPNLFDRALRAPALAALALATVGGGAHAQAPITACDAAGIGAAKLVADGPPVSVTSVSTGTAGPVSYCLVKALVPEAINVWVGLPMNGAWNGRWQSVGGGGYAGGVNAPNGALAAGYAAAATDTGHTGGRPDMPFGGADGSFGMLPSGQPNVAAQTDFAYRSEHLMAVIGKQLVKAFYGSSDDAASFSCAATGRTN
jgi:hypothetical protein